MTISFPDRRYAAYIFDCDGTLVDPMPLGHAAWRAAIATSGADFDFSWELSGIGIRDFVFEPDPARHV